MTLLRFWWSVVRYMWHNKFHTTTTQPHFHHTATPPDGNSSTLPHHAATLPHCHTDTLSHTTTLPHTTIPIHCHTVTHCCTTTHAIQCPYCQNVTAVPVLPKRFGATAEAGAVLLRGATCYFVFINNWTFSCNCMQLQSTVTMDDWKQLVLNSVSRSVSYSHTVARIVSISSLA